MAKLLLVDDDTAALAWMGQALQQAGHEVRQALGAREALALLASWRPDLILADILMPDLDGYGFSRLVSKTGPVPLMFLSVVRAEAEAVLRGVNGFLRKPFSPAKLREAVARALSERRGEVTVLVVDDDPDARFVLRSVLEPSFCVLEAADGREGLNVLDRFPVGLVITDVHMPNLDGMQFVRAIRRDRRLRALPIIVQSADRAVVRAPLWNELQVSNVLSKDAFLDWLLERIDQRVSSGASEGPPAP